MKSNEQLKQYKVSDITPKQMIGAFIGNAPIQAEVIIEKYYLGKFIKVGGIIYSINLMSSYVSLNFHDSEGVLISCNFSKPVSSDVSILKKGSEVFIMGRVFNVGENIVALDDCKLLKHKKATIDIKNGGDAGEIFIAARNIIGNGKIEANGGDGFVGGKGGKITLISENNHFTGKIEAKGGQSLNQSKWWEKSWIQVILLISALVGIAGFILLIYEK